MLTLCWVFSINVLWDNIVLVRCGFARLNKYMLRICIDEWKYNKNKNISLKSLEGIRGSFNLAWELGAVLTASNSLGSDRDEKILSWIYSLENFLLSNHIYIHIYIKKYIPDGVSSFLQLVNDEIKISRSWIF